jgi:hypothetical protein
MKMPDSYIKKILKYTSVADLIKNLYLKALIEAHPTVRAIDNICAFNENKIRNEFQYIIQYSDGHLGVLIQQRLISLGVENQIVTLTKENKRTDIEFNIPGLKYIVECKKVKGVNKAQYIYSGISRFVQNEYTNKHDHFASMCSFVVKGDVGKIVLGTKKRVDDYHCTEIRDDKIGTFDYFYSKHTKVDEAELLISHLFFDMR